MNLIGYLRVLRLHWVSIATFCVAGVLTAVIYILLAQPTYESRTKLFVAVQNSNNVAELQQGNTFTQARVQSYIETVGTPLVLQPVIDSLGLSVSPAQLSRTVDASSKNNTVIITVTAKDESPVQAAAIAQSVAESLIDAVELLETPQTGESPVRLSVVSPATAPEFASNPNRSLVLALGILVGLSAGLASAFLRTTLDTRVRNDRDVARITNSAILGGIAYDADAEKKPLVTQASAQSSRAESFRQIRTNLQFARVSSTSKTILVTSSLPGEGKSTTACNMAIAMAEAGNRVALVDADLRRPMVANYLGLEGSAGLTTALIGSATLSELMQPWGRNELVVLTSGAIPPNPSELLGSEEMAMLLLELEKEFDVIIIDAPPLIPVTDAAVLAQGVGGVVLVAGSKKIRTQDLEKSISALKFVDAHLLGIVMNLLPTKGPDAYAYGYYSYDSKPVPRKNQGRDDSNALSGSHLKTRRRGRRKEASFDDILAEANSNNALRT